MLVARSVPIQMLMLSDPFVRLLFSDVSEAQGRPREVSLTPFLDPHQQRQRHAGTQN